jgi:hypothetical protein
MLKLKEMNDNSFQKQLTFVVQAGDASNQQRRDRSSDSSDTIISATSSNM